MSWLGAMPRPGLSLRCKRALDVAVSGGILICTSPCIVSLLGLNTLVHGWSPVFVQVRPGLHGRTFHLLKLRTMTNERDAATGHLLPDDARLTRFGRLLRRTSLDEVPSLVNVLLGDMSLVGPRPLLEKYLERYSARQMRRHEMPPGVTGHAQVNGRNRVSWSERFEMDVWYVENWSLGLDLKILAATVGAVLSRRDISARGHVTMAEFEGNG